MFSSHYKLNCRAADGAKSHHSVLVHNRANPIPFGAQTKMPSSSPYTHPSPLQPRNVPFAPPPNVFKFKGWPPLPEVIPFFGQKIYTFPEMEIMKNEKKLVQNLQAGAVDIRTDVLSGAMLRNVFEDSIDIHSSMDGYDASDESYVYDSSEDEDSLVNDDEAFPALPDFDFEDSIDMHSSMDGYDASDESYVYDSSEDEDSLVNDDEPFPALPDFDNDHPALPDIDNDDGEADDEAPPSLIERGNDTSDYETDSDYSDSESDNDDEDFIPSEVDDDDDFDPDISKEIVPTVTYDSQMEEACMSIDSSVLPSINEHSFDRIELPNQWAVKKAFLGKNIVSILQPKY